MMPDDKLKEALVTMSQQYASLRVRVDQYLSVPLRPSDVPLAPGDDRTPRRALIVEDEAMVAEVISAQVQSAGFEVEVAHTLGAATDLLLQKRYGVVILDMRLDPGDGWELAEIVPRNGTLLILISGALPQKQLSALSSRFSCTFLQKPFRREQLMSLILPTIKMESAE